MVRQVQTTIICNFNISNEIKYNLLVCNRFPKKNSNQMCQISTNYIIISIEWSNRDVGHMFSTWFVKVNNLLYKKNNIFWPN